MQRGLTGLEREPPAAEEDDVGVVAALREGDTEDDPGVAARFDGDEGPPAQPRNGTETVPRPGREDGLPPPAVDPAPRRGERHRPQPGRPHFGGIADPRGDGHGGFEPDPGGVEPAQVGEQGGEGQVRDQRFQPGEATGLGQEVDEREGGEEGGGLLAGAGATELGEPTAGWWVAGAGSEACDEVQRTGERFVGGGSLLPCHGARGHRSDRQLSDRFAGDGSLPPRHSASGHRFDRQPGERRRNPFSLPRTVSHRSPLPRPGAQHQFGRGRQPGAQHRFGSSTGPASQQRQRSRNHPDPPVPPSQDVPEQVPLRLVAGPGVRQPDHLTEPQGPGCADTSVPRQVGAGEAQLEVVAGVVVGQHRRLVVQAGHRVGHSALHRLGQRSVRRRPVRQQVARVVRAAQHRGDHLPRQPVLAPLQPPGHERRRAGQRRVAHRGRRPEPVQETRCPRRIRLPQQRDVPLPRRTGPGEERVLVGRPRQHRPVQLLPHAPLPRSGPRARRTETRIGSGLVVGGR
ncbi:hypothetical protein [Amycolatopsis sp. lyj-23]|uniref:hypothetical protein n=1 Tax=Amycolatopsis sp. lyj-23 TaxID=2789283 RepID=UPI0039787F00